ncbi:hypothetical protein AB0M02_11245 [Actinoplanes sp. NPDC051861]|uniref:hypothetical protein n=1 Tax=Actinoplanes sp. NPDC051861 TaxID=3155170 RepID=UPI003427281A
MDSPVAQTDPEPEIDSQPSAPDLPNISDYWPDLPQRLGPEADHYELPGAEPDRTSPAWQAPASARLEPATNRVTVEIPAGVRPRRSRWKSVALLAALVGVGGGAAWVIMKPTGGTPEQPTFADRSAPPAEAPANPPVSIGTSPPAGPVPDAATFEMVDGSTQIFVTIGAVDDGWFRVTTPQGSGVTPTAVVEDTTLRLRIEPTDTEGSARVDVVLSDDVDWAIRMRGGFRTAMFDLSRGTVSKVDLVGGVNQLNLALPLSDATVPIVMSGGIKTWRITTAGQVPVRAAFRRGAGTVTLYGDEDRGVPRQAELAKGDGDGGIDLDAEAGVGSLTVAAR